MTLTQVSKQISTLLPDGTQLQTWTAMGDSWAHVENRMAERKQIILEYTSDVDITGFNIYINIAMTFRENLLLTLTGKGSVHYATSIPDATFGNVYPAGMQTTTLVPLETIDDYEVSIIPDGGFSFQVVINYYQMYDKCDYIYPTTSDNRVKFLLDSTFNPQIILPNNSNINNFANPSPNYLSTYRNPPDGIKNSPRVYIYMQNPSAPYPGVSTFKEEKFPGYGAGWYFKNKYNASPWFTNTYFEVSRGGTVFSDLSATLGSDVMINANSDNALNPVTHFAVWMIRTDATNNNTDFLSSYEADFQLIYSGNAGGAKIQGPMTNIDEVSPQQFQATFKVPPLVFNGKYRFIGIAYSSVFGQPHRVNSFISGEYVCNALPSYTGQGFRVRASLDDYNKQYQGHDLQCCIEERMRAKVKMYFPFDKWKNDIYNRLGLVTSNDIRRYLLQVHVQIYEEYFDTTLGLGIVKNLFDFISITNDGTGNFSTWPNMTADFHSSHAEFTYSWRNRFEANNFSVFSTVNGVAVPAMAPQYWGGKTLKVRFIFLFHYDDYFMPFTDEVIVEQQMRVKDYGEMTVRHYDEDTNDFDQLENFCNDENPCFIGIIADGTLDDRKLITNIYPLGAGVNGVEESEAWEGNQLPQLGTSKIINQEEDYHEIASETAAKFCVDTNELIVNSQYVISAMAKKYEDTGFRVTETRDQRITEEKDRRTINQ